LRFDDVEFLGLRPTVGYIDLREHAPMSLVDFILRKLGRSRSASSDDDTDAEVS
jgi:hypothetical protein